MFVLVFVCIEPHIAFLSAAVITIYPMSMLLSSAQETINALLDRDHVQLSLTMRINCSIAI